MKFTVVDEKTGSNLLLWKDENNFDRLFYTRDNHNKYFTIAWNRGKQQIIIIDGRKEVFKENSLVTLLFNQSFSFEKPQDIVAWQFNREFYCIMDHDEEVSCVGFLFGVIDFIFIDLDNVALEKLQLLMNMFVGEFNTPDKIQREVLLVLLKRLIVFVTRLARSEYVPEEKVQDEKFHVIRKFNVLVELSYRTEHGVAFYAQQLNKSPKTLSNLFAIYNHKTPLQVIQERILIEAKRLLYYTNQTVKEITFELGFDDAAYFSNFFKRHTSLSPQDFRNSKNSLPQGK
jgi:AraC family transcriptional activator of pobA